MIPALLILCVGLISLALIYRTRKHRRYIRNLQEEFKKQHDSRTSWMKDLAQILGGSKSKQNTVLEMISEKVESNPDSIERAFKQEQDFRSQFEKAIKEKAYSGSAWEQLVVKYQEWVKYVDDFIELYSRKIDLYNDYLTMFPVSLASRILKWEPAVRPSL